MEKFEKLTARAALLDLINIDTDMIIPKQFLKTIKRTGLGAHLFDEMRYDSNGNEIADFVLNQPAFKESEILVSGDNFGCGSSREHAPWALLDFGIRCIIAPGFADIFYNNCFKNGILPVKLDADSVNELKQVALNEKNKITVNLPEQMVIADNKKYHFKIDDFRKTCLLEGLDDISITLKNSHKIKAFEDKQKEQAPWLYNTV